MIGTSELRTSDSWDDQPTRVRFGVLGALALLAMTAYLTRVCIAAANTTIQSELDLTPEQMGNVLAAFSIGYLVFQVPGGWLGNRFGNQLILPLLSVLSSLATAGSGLATSASGLWASRMGLGLAQAGMIPCAAKVLSDWFTESRRGTASAVFASSMSVGAVLASGLTAVLIPWTGWRPLFHAYAAVGVLWAVGFAGWFRNRPEDHPQTNRAERDLIRGGPPGRCDAPLPDGDSGGPDTNAPAPPWLVMLTSLSMWAICGQAFFRAFGYIFFVTWFPAYLEEGYGAQVAGAGMLTVIPLATTVVGTLTGGSVIDALLARTQSKWISRSLTSAVALGLCAAATLAAAWAHDPLAAVLVISSGMFFSGLGNPAAWAATMDISGRHTALVFGIMNMSGVVAGIVCSKLLGHLFAYIQETQGDWNWVLYLFTANYLAGALCWIVLDPNRSAIERQRGDPEPTAAA